MSPLPVMIMMHAPLTLVIHLKAVFILVWSVMIVLILVMMHWAFATHVLASVITLPLVARMMMIALSMFAIQML
jgi:hypothetical protein